MKTIEHPDYTLTYDDSQSAAARVSAILLEWFNRTEHFSGESIQQSDQTYEDAPELLEKIAEKGFKFKQKWK